MDTLVFLLGLGLITASGTLVMASGGALDSWAGVGLTGGTGVLGVVYGLLVAKPRNRVREAVNHLMFLKIVFLAYLRQLHVLDTAYTRRLVEGQPMTLDEVDEFSRMAGTTMQLAVEQLVKSDRTAHAAELKEARANHPLRGRPAVATMEGAPLSIANSPGA
jgi:hypothetical protein